MTGPKLSETTPTVASRAHSASGYRVKLGNRPTSGEEIIRRQRSPSFNRDLSHTDDSVGLSDSFLMKQKVEDVESKLGHQALSRASNDLKQLKSEAVYLE